MICGKIHFILDPFLPLLICFICFLCPSNSEMDLSGSIPPLLNWCPHYASLTPCPLSYNALYAPDVLMKVYWSQITTNATHGHQNWTALGRNAIITERKLIPQVHLDIKMATTREKRSTSIPNLPLPFPSFTKSKCFDPCD